MAGRVMRADIIDFHCLVADWPALRAKLVQRKWLVEDPENPGNYVTKDGMHIVHLGPAVITPATYDADGNELTPAVLDTVSRAYLRLYGDHKLAEEIAPRTDVDGDPVSVLNWTKLGEEIRSVGTWDDARKGYKIRAAGKDRFWVLDETQITPDHEWQ